MLNTFHPDFTAEYAIEIFAPPDKVWDWLSRVEMWTSWRQDVSSAYWVRGEGRNGVLKWRLRKTLGFTAQVAAWEHERSMRWDAVSYGTHFIHDLKIDGDYKSTRVSLQVSGKGGLLRFFPTRAIFVHQLNRSNEIWLGALKTKLEAGKDDSTSPPPDRKNPFENNIRFPSELGQFDRR